MGLKAVIFVPKRAPQGKVAQLMIFGARLVVVDGGRKRSYAAHTGQAMLVPSMLFVIGVCGGACRITP